MLSVSDTSDRGYWRVGYYADPAGFVPRELCTFNHRWQGRPAAVVFYSCFLPARDDCVDTSSYAERAGHCCILGSCVGSAYMGAQP
jgi:hypothetical protein